MALTKIGKEGITGISNSADATAITIDSSERVGIGISPTVKLQIEESTTGDAVKIAKGGNYILIGGSGSGTQYIKGYEGTVAFGNEFSGNTIFLTGNTERSRIDSSGRMLLNTTTHTNGRLNVTESLNIQPCLGLRSSYASNTGNFVLFTSNDGTGAGAISHINASTVAYNTSSDYRLKQNVTYDFDATTRLKQLQPARFSWNHDDTNTLVDGFLAHEVQSVVPEAITGTHNQVEVWKDGEELPDGVSVGDNKLDEDGNTIPVYQGIDQSKLVPLLVKTIQELEARIIALENA